MSQRIAWYVDNPHIWCQKCCECVREGETQNGYFPKQGSFLKTDEKYTHSHRYKSLNFKRDSWVSSPRTKVPPKVFLLRKTVYCSSETYLLHSSLSSFCTMLFSTHNTSWFPCNITCPFLPLALAISYSYILECPFHGMAAFHLDVSTITIFFSERPSLTTLTQSDFVYFSYHITLLYHVYNTVII